MGVVVMAGWAVFLGTDSTIASVKIDGALLPWLYRRIGCRIVEPVRICSEEVFGRGDIEMLADEEGLLKSDPRANPTASALSGVGIVGNAVLLRVGETEDGDLDWTGFETEEAAKVICGQIYVTVVAAVEKLGGKNDEERDTHIRARGVECGTEEPSLCPRGSGIDDRT